MSFSPSERAARVYLIEDDPFATFGIRMALEAIPGVELVGTSADGRDGLEGALATQPEVVIVDLKLPRLPGLEVLRELKERLFLGRVLVLTGRLDPQSHERATELGAEGYLQKPVGIEALAEAIAAVLRGERYVGLAGEDFPGIKPAGRDDALATLSPRERELVPLICAGYNTAEIAARLKIAPNTARTHRQNLFRKLNVHGAVELVARLGSGEEEA